MMDCMKKTGIPFLRRWLKMIQPPATNKQQP